MSDKKKPPIDRSRRRERAAKKERVRKGEELICNFGNRGEYNDSSNSSFAPSVGSLTPPSSPPFQKPALRSQSYCDAEARSMRNPKREQRGRVLASSSPPTFPAASGLKRKRRQMRQHGHATRNASLAEEVVQFNSSSQEKDVENEDTNDDSDNDSSQVPISDQLRAELISNEPIIVQGDGSVVVSELIANNDNYDNDDDTFDYDVESTTTDGRTDVKRNNLPEEEESSPFIFWRKRRRDGNNSRKKNLMVMAAFIIAWLVVMSFIAGAVAFFSKNGNDDTLPGNTADSSTTDSTRENPKVLTQKDNSGSMLGGTRPIPSSSPTRIPLTPTLVSQPSIGESSRRSNIFKFVESISGSSALQDTSSAQYAAFHWIVDYDPLQLVPSDKSFLNRYILATLYFSTTTAASGWKYCGSSTTSFEDDTSGSNVIDTILASSCSEHHVRFLSGRDACLWYGVACDENGFVKSIRLKGNSLYGTLPPELNKLPNLASLDLSKNSIKSTIPTQYGTMSQLKNLLLQNNNIQGAIPTELGSLPNLSLLGLGNNQLTGTLPQSIFLTDLTHLDADRNKLVGSMPASIYSESSKLERIDLRQNSLTGTIFPSSSSSLRLPNLRHLLLSNNNFIGTLPPEVFDPNVVPNLQLLNISDNVHMNVGFIPKEVGSSLKTLDLRNVNLIGTIPESLGNMINLETVDLSFNQLTGTVPSSIGKIDKLSFLDVGYNHLQGTMPKEICALTYENNKRLDLLAADCADEPPPIWCSCCTVCHNGY